MALSGSIDFNMTRNEIINDALIHCGAIEEGESPSAAATEFAARQLNRMVNTWSGTGLKLWRQKDAVLFLTKGTGQYAIGTGHATTADDAVKTEVATAGVASDTSLVVDSITGIASGDNIGVQLDDGTLHWTTVNGAPTGTTVVLTTGLASASAVDSHVYAYTTKLPRPIRIMNARRRAADGNDIPIAVVSREIYFDTPNKTVESLPVRVYYDPQLTTGQMYVWPSPSSVQDRIYFTADLPLQDFDTSADNPDIAPEWLDAMVWGLAMRLMPSYGTPADIRAEIRLNASDSFKAAQDMNVEFAPLCFELGY